MRMLLFIIVPFCLVIAQAQNTETDSLKKSLLTTKDDTKRVSVLEGLSYAYLSSYPDTAMQYALEGLRLAQKINYPKGKATCTNALGNVYFTMGDYPKALQMYLSYLELKEGLKEHENIGVAYFNLANVYTEQQDYRHALFYIFKAKYEDEKVKDSSAILYDLYSLGNIYMRMQKADSSLYYLKQSYQLATKMDDKNMLGAILNSFGETYFFMNDIALAEKYYTRSIPYTEAISDNEVLTSNYYGLAKIFKKKGMLDSAVYYSRKALLIAKKAPFLKQVLEISNFLTDLFSTQKQFDSAFHYQQLSIATKDSLFNVEQVKKIQNLKFQEQQRQQSIETAKLEYRNKVKLFIVIFASIVFLAIAGVLWRNNKQKQKANALLQQQKEKVELTLSELKATQSQLIQREKMASLGELTAGIAHEIQNPLNFVNNFSEVNEELIDEMKQALLSGNTEEALGVAQEIEQNLEKINHHGKRADAIVKGMLQHSRSSTGTKEPTDVNSLTEEYLRLSYHGMRAANKSFNTTLQTDFEANLGKINIIPQEIGRVLLNLFNNAFYSLIEKKKQQGDDYEPAVLVSTRKVDNKIEIKVRDNGIGIPQKVLDKIFQPFFTTKPTGQGTGLGLSLSYDIIKAHGGELKVETMEGEYAEFIIQLPLNNV